MNIIILGQFISVSDTVHSCLFYNFFERAFCLVVETRVEKGWCARGRHFHGYLSNACRFDSYGGTSPAFASVRIIASAHALALCSFAESTFLKQHSHHVPSSNKAGVIAGSLTDQWNFRLYQGSTIYCTKWESGGEAGIFASHLLSLRHSCQSLFVNF